MLNPFLKFVIIYAWSILKKTCQAKTKKEKVQVLFNVKYVLIWLILLFLFEDKGSGKGSNMFHKKWSSLTWYGV